MIGQSHQLHASAEIDADGQSPYNRLVLVTQKECHSSHYLLSAASTRMEGMGKGLPQSGVTCDIGMTACLGTSVQ